MSSLTYGPPVKRTRDVALRSLRIADKARRMQKSIYSLLPVEGSHRKINEPRVDRHWRPKVIAQAGPAAFFTNRFYNVDKWYKARIDKPIRYPELKTIDPFIYHQSLDERLCEMHAHQNDISDVGFKHTPTVVTNEMRKQHRTINRHQFEKAARERTLKVDLDAVEKESSRDYYAAHVVRQLAHHYQIFNHCLHEHVFFTPIMPLDVVYGNHSVKAGNVIPTHAMINSPSIKYPASDSSLWTLLMLNLDGNVYANDSATLQWLVTDIKGADVSTGNIVAGYLQPLPPFGIGYCRVVYLLFAQNEKQEQQLKLPNIDETLESRTFDPRTFYKQNEDVLTPATLAFSQVRWDDSVRVCFQQQLNLSHPIYKFDFKQPQPVEQEEFPDKPVPFNEYLDQQMGHKKVEERLLRERLDKLSPFDLDPVRPPMHNLHWRKDKETLSPWQFTEQRKRNLSIGKYKALYENALVPSDQLAQSPIRIKEKPLN